MTAVSRTRFVAPTALRTVERSGILSIKEGYSRQHETHVMPSIAHLR